MELQTNLAGISLEHPLMNAAGTCKLLEGKDGVEKLARSATSAIMIGSIPLEFREGNSGNVYWADGRFSLNSLGIPNPGAKYYKKALPEMVRVAHGQGKKLFVSAAGFSPSEYAQLAVVAFEGGADLVELNFGCPNLWKDDQQKRIACFDPDLSGEILYFTEKEVGQEAKISVKISPFSDPFALGEIANVIKQSKMVKAVTAINTFPNAFGYDGKGNPCITPAGGL
ncbi:dihydroorotate dehydrogenase, partial [Patescibacteria group bacterium]|nr:dihydroorotate dehydrogenase [Patescibacteria group bacterium]